MDITLILALTIPISLTIYGGFYYKTVLLFVKKEELEREEQKIKPPFTAEVNEEEIKAQQQELNSILDEYLNGGR